MADRTPLERLSPSLVHPAHVPTGWDDKQTAGDRVHRAIVRDVSGMQKEAVVWNDWTDASWRLASDEGDYLDGDDIAPPPLGHMAAGMVAVYFDSLLAVAEQRGVTVTDATIELDNYYTMKGSALKGDMTGGALSPELTVRLESDAADPDALVATAVDRAAVTTLAEEPLENEFSLSLAGERLEPDRVPGFDGPMPDDPAGVFDGVDRPERGHEPDPVRATGRSTEEPEAQEKYTAGQGSSLEAEQDRVLHIRGEGSLREEGLYRVLQKIFSPRGSMFEFLADRDPSLGGERRAPDGLSYVATGLAFCFMTQFGRYAQIRRKQLDGYRIVQDLPWSGEPGEPMDVNPLITHVYLETPEGDEFARDLLDFSEQTCFLHALCGSAVRPEINVESAG